MNFYIYFNAETGEIHKVSNEAIENENYKIIDKDLYVQFIRGEKDYTNFLIVPNAKIKGEYDLIEKTKNTVEFDVDKSIHRFEKTDIIDETDVFYIIQDTQENKWQAFANLNSNYIAFLNQTRDYYETVKQIYVTEENDPNILLDVIHVPMKNFLEAEVFDVESKYSGTTKRTDVSLYAGVVHETYKHMVK